MYLCFQNVVIIAEKENEDKQNLTNANRKETRRRAVRVAVKGGRFCAAGSRRTSRTLVVGERSRIFDNKKTDRVDFDSFLFFRQISLQGSCQNPVVEIQQYVCSSDNRKMKATRRHRTFSLSRNLINLRLRTSSS